MIPVNRTRSPARTRFSRHAAPGLNSFAVLTTACNTYNSTRFTDVRRACVAGMNNWSMRRSGRLFALRIFKSTRSSFDGLSAFGAAISNAEGRSTHWWFRWNSFRFPDARYEIYIPGWKRKMRPIDLFNEGNNNGSLIQLPELKNRPRLVARCFSFIRVNSISPSTILTYLSPGKRRRNGCGWPRGNLYSAL